MRLQFSDSRHLDEEVAPCAPWSSNDVCFSSLPGKWEAVALRKEDDWENVSDKDDVISLSSDGERSMHETPVDNVFEKHMSLHFSSPYPASLPSLKALTHTARTDSQTRRFKPPSLFRLRPVGQSSVAWAGVQHRL